ALPRRPQDRTPTAADGRQGAVRRAARPEPGNGRPLAAATHGNGRPSRAGIPAEDDVQRRSGRRQVQAAVTHGPGLPELIAEATAVVAALEEARQRARRLTAALRRHRRRERLVHSTLATLQQIRLPEIAG